MKRKTFRTDLKRHLPHMLDAVFAGNHDHYPNGWVIMEANDKGRACVEALFPGAHIAWGAPGNIVPADWHGFEIHVPDVVAALPETKLPLEVTGGADLYEANPDALALLLAFGVVRQGGRAGLFRDGCLDIIQCHDHDGIDAGRNAHERTDLCRSFSVDAPQGAAINKRREGRPQCI